MKLKDIIEEVLFYVGIPVVTLYPLGFVGLGVQMWRDPLFPYENFDAVWEAVAMVPHIVVIATGVKLVYLTLISTVLGLGVTLLTLHVVGLDSNEPGPVARRGGLWGAYLLFLVPSAILLLLSGVNVDRSSEVFYLAGFLTLSVGGGILVGFMRSLGRRDVLLPAHIIAFLAVVAAALCIGALHTPSLPVVTILAEVNGETDCSNLGDRTYVKLDETPGYWHVYNETGMYSLNEEEVGVVRYQDCERFQNRN